MQFQVDYDKVCDVGYFLKEKSEELDTLYRDVLKICNEIETNYISEDSSIYLAKYRKYLTDFIKENQDLYDGGNVLNDASSIYNEEENRWAKAITNEELLKRGNYHG